MTQKTLCLGFQPPSHCVINRLKPLKSLMVQTKLDHYMKDVKGCYQGVPPFSLRPRLLARPPVRPTFRSYMDWNGHLDAI